MIQMGELNTQVDGVFFIFFWEEHFLHFFFEYIKRLMFFLFETISHDEFIMKTESMVLQMGGHRFFF